MYQINEDITTGIITISDSWSATATGDSAPPTLTQPGQEYTVSFINLTDVQKFKSFTFDYLGQTENRYLSTDYRVSREGSKWTSWLTLDSNITNFPPFTSSDLMFIDIRFTRKGTSQIGSIKLLDYNLKGDLSRNLVDGSAAISITPTNKTVVIKPPYIYKVFQLTDIEILSRGDMSNVSIKWRFSQDYGRTVTDWEPFTKENVTTKRISPIRFFQVEYLIESTTGSPVSIYDINIIGDFQNVTLDYTKTNLYGVRENCNCIKLGLVSDSNSNMNTDVGGQNNMLSTTQPSQLPQLTDDQKNALFKPYQLTAATTLLNKMSNDANSIFGHEVVYFLTDPDRKGIDYTFHEYQLMNYVCDELIKISVENNQFPENTGAINQFDLSLFDSFEVHIPKEVFKTAFGEEKRPSKEDFLWFCEINKMFTVEHSQAFRGFNNNAIYYKVMLKKYVQKANIIAGNQTIQDRVKQLTKNSTIDELFGLENIQDKRSIANKEQFTPLTLDKLRVDINARIEKELIENAEIIISKTNYDLSSVGFGLTGSSEAITYRNMKNYFKVSDNIGYMCWFKINNYTYNDNYHLFNYYDNRNSLGFDMTINSDLVKVTLNTDEYDLPLINGLLEDTWYSYVLNVDQRNRNISQYIYKRNVDNEEDASNLSSTKLKLVYKNSMDMTPVEFKLETEIRNGEDVQIPGKLFGSDMSITNIRLFVNIIPEEQHNKILNQTIIRDDSKYLLFADNANQRLVLPNYPLGQIGPNGPGYYPEN
jgi:hypothetical protein